VSGLRTATRPLRRRADALLLKVIECGVEEEFAGALRTATGSVFVGYGSSDLAIIPRMLSVLFENAAPG
jgi:hypothetical protein